MKLASRWRRFTRRRPSTALVISGGGCKAVFGLGVGKVLLEAGVAIDALSATSAGTAMALALVCDKADDAVESFVRISGDNKRNFYPGKLVKGERPFPHEEMYRYMIAEHMDMERIRSTKFELAFNALRVPTEWATSKTKVASVVTEVLNARRKEYKNADKGVFEPLMNKVAEREQLEEVVFRNEHLATEQKVEDIVMATSCAPPVTAFKPLDDGHYYLDGGMTNNLPVSSVWDHDLILAVYYHPKTRGITEELYPDERKSVINKTVYVYPEQVLPVETWDYTDPEGVQVAYDLGRWKGEQVLRMFNY